MVDSQDQNRRVLHLKTENPGSSDETGYALNIINRNEVPIEQKTHEKEGLKDIILMSMEEDKSSNIKKTNIKHSAMGSLNATWKRKQCKKNKNKASSDPQASRIFYYHMTKDILKGNSSQSTSINVKLQGSNHLIPSNDCYQSNMLRSNNYNSCMNQLINSNLVNCFAQKQILIQSYFCNYNSNMSFSNYNCITSLNALTSNHHADHTIYSNYSNYKS